MMFTLQQIEAARSKSKTGADFPRYVREIKALGLEKYVFMLENGRTVYYGIHGYQVAGGPVYPDKIIHPAPLTAQFEKNLRAHQGGGSDFPTFCAQAAAAGVHHWEVNTVAMTVIYFDPNGNPVLTEAIPGP